MALPVQYKQQLAMQPGPSHMMSSGMHMSSSPLTFNILKERLRPSGSMGDRKDATSPFMHSAHGNPSFTPQKVGKSSASVDARMPKPPKAPEKPLLPYWRYSKKVWDVTKAQYPELKLWELSKIIAKQWKELSDEDKQEFVSAFESDKVEYEKQLRTHHSSPAYLAYLSAKSRSKTDEQQHETHDRRKQQDRRIDIQPAEDEDDMDDGFSVKHVAYARYLRNHRLINEIFSDAIVPDVRSVVTTQRMHVLKRQVQSLAMHQTKLQNELQQIEEKFDTKKRKFVESSEIFQDELKRHCKPAVDDEKFKQLVERQYELLKRDKMKMDDHSKISQPLLPQASGSRAEEAETTPQPATATSAPPEAQNPPEPMEVEVEKKKEPPVLLKEEKPVKPEEKVEEKKVAPQEKVVPPPLPAAPPVSEAPPVTAASHPPGPPHQGPPPHSAYPNYNYPYPGSGYPPYGGHPPPQPPPPHSAYQGYPPAGPYYHHQQYGPQPNQPPYGQRPPPMHYGPSEMGHPPPPPQSHHYPGPYPGPMPPPPHQQAPQPAQANQAPQQQQQPTPPPPEGGAAAAPGGPVEKPASEPKPNADGAEKKEASE